nr:hypothetical protein L204_03573 [Cryptococcus depauperatus CBS 7855]
MVQFTTIVAMVGMPMLVMASPLADTSSALPLAQRTVQTGGPLYGLGSEPSCLGISTDDGAGWFTTTLCALATVHPDRVNKTIIIDKGTVDNAEAASFTVYYLDPKDSTDTKDLRTRQVYVNYKNAIGAGHDNENGAWFAGGFREAIKTIDGTGIEKDNLFSSIGSKDAKQVAEVGKWAFKYLTGMDGVLEPVSKDTTRWGMSWEQTWLEADKSVDRWMSSIGQDPMIILTNDAPPAKGLKPNQYYTIHSSTDNGKSHIMLWSTTVKTMQDSFVEVDSEGLKASTRNLYHLANWPAY